MTTLSTPTSPAAGFSTPSNPAGDVLFHGAALAAPRVAQIAGVYEKKGVLHSEMLAACGAFDLLGCDLIIESGRCRGQSTSMLADYFAGRDDARGKAIGIVSVELTRDDSIAPFAEARLAGRTNVELLYGDSLELLPRIAGANPGARIGLLIDGPKSYTAIKLIERMTAAHPNILVACLHDTARGSDARRDLEAGPFFSAFTDDPRYVRTYYSLDESCVPIAGAAMNSDALADILAGRTPAGSYGPTLAVLIPKTGRHAAQRRAPAPTNALNHYFLPTGYVEQSGALTHDANRDGGVSYWSEWRIAESARYQRYVYTWARSLIRRNSLRSVLDVGCGVGTKLGQLICPVCRDVTGMDQRSALDVATTRAPDAALVEANLESPPATLGRWYDLVMCVDVIEHLADPDPLFEFIRRACGPRGLALFSTPERHRERGRACNCSPKPEHVREWAFDEFAALLHSRGFTVLRHRLAPKDDRPALACRHDERAFRRGAADRSSLACQAVLCRPTQ